MMSEYGDFIETLRKNRRFILQLADRRYLAPTEPRYVRLDLNKNLGAVLKDYGIERRGEKAEHSALGFLTAGHIAVQ